MKKYMVDTNVLLNYSNSVFEDLVGNIYIPMAVIGELDKQKELDNSLGFRARRAIREIKAIKTNKNLKDGVIYNDSKVFVVSDEKDFESKLDFDVYRQDDKILRNCNYLGEDVILVTNDISLTIKADAIGVKTMNYGSESSAESEYTGVKKIIATDKNKDKVLEVYQNPHRNIFNLLLNQYLIIYTRDGQNDIMRWNGSTHISIRKKKFKSSIEPKNELQECVMDLLTESNIPIKIITGVAGSGKNYLILNQMFKDLKEQKYQKLVYARNPEGDTDSAQVGFLKGTFEDKFAPFLKPLTDNAGFNKYELEGMLAKEDVELTIPAYVKGRTLRDCCLLVDEAEDLTVRTLKGLGTRIGENSCIVFFGDYNQVESKYKNNNGLLRLIEQKCGDKLVGYVNLEEDVRSEASKVFIDL